ncbi:MAG: zinc-binding dehydrogenase [Paracoccus sp. (in: a-proteobacteria)]|nr:zinc-binding dehydrogenase [Paracoccus sp. (in: a-proteobacteria)]
MDSAAHSRFGDPAKVLSLADSPMPEPGPGQVRIRMVLAPIHNHDLWTVRGEYGYKPALPAIGGTEAMGLIDALGPDVTGLTKGQRVAVASVHGTWAEYFLAPAAAVMPLPPEIPDEAAAQLIAMPFSAITLLDFLDVRPGDWVVQNAANGAVGRVLATLAKARGVHVANLVRRDDAVAAMTALGFETSLATDTPGWQDRLRAMIGPAGARAAIDSIGGDASGALMAILAEGGLLVSFGSMTGAPMQISSGDLIFKQATVKGFWASKISAAMPPEKRRALMGELIAQVASGALPLPVEAIFPLSQITRAVTASLTPGKTGKVLLRP